MARKSHLGQYSAEDIRTRSCISAGVSAAVSPWFRGEFLIFPENVLGLVKADAFKVPFSELAMHTRAAGQTIQAWQCDDDVRTCAVIYTKKDGSCGYVDGLASEVLSHELQRVTKAIWGRKRSELGRARRVRRRRK